jgi:hypothetical protein
MEALIRTGVSYFGNRNPRHFRADLEEMKSHYCNFIVHTFSENDQLFYKYTLAELIKLSKAAGLEVYVDPWGVLRIFGGEATSDFAFKHRGVCQILNTGETAPGACMNHPRVRDFMLRWIDDAVEIGADVLFWDEPHFFIDWENKKTANERWSCWCSYCQEKFKQISGMPLPTFDQLRLNSDAAGELADEFIRFREDSIVEFLTMLCNYARSKGVRNAVCLLPHKERRYGVVNWAKVAGILNLDIFGTDPYWLWFEQRVDQFVGDFAREVVQLSRQFYKQPQIWIQNFKIPAGREDEIREALAVAYAEGVRNFAAWSYYGSGYMSYIKSGNPQKVWDTLGEVYGQIVRGEWQ